MDPSLDAGAILNLGRKLVRELELEHTCETLSKWMAHYLAEQMSMVETAESQQEKDAAQSRCCELILRVWENRSSLPGKFVPLGNVTDALNSLIAMRSEQQVFSDAFASEGPPDDNHWLKFSEKTHDIGCRLLRISFLAGLLENNFGAEKQWVDEHGDALSDDERNLIQALDGWLNLKPYFFTTTDDKSMGGLPPEERTDLVLKELDALSKKQRQAFLNLKQHLSQQAKHKGS